MRTLVPSKLIRIMSAVLLSAFLLFGVIGFIVVSRMYLPAEDAIILHQYSRTLANTGVIAFYPGGPHAEGATDFLWMVFLASGYLAGVPQFLLTAIVNLFCVLAFGIVLVKASENCVLPYRVALISALVLLCPQIAAALQGFAVLPMGLLLAGFLWKIEEGEDTTASILALALWLMRPDGLIFVAPLLAYRYLAVRRSGKRHWYRPYLAYFVLPGFLYFLWRWHYFNSFWPLPFLVKSDTHRHWGLFVGGSARTSVPYLLFALIVLAAGLHRVWKQRLLTLRLVVSLLIPTCFYATMRLDQDRADRFFFYILVVTGTTLAIEWRRLCIPRTRIITVALLAWLVLLGNSWQSYLHDYLHNTASDRRLQTIASAVAEKLPQARLLTTEAGIIPYYTNWSSYDAWGLNTEEYAQHLIQASDVRLLHPDVIVLHQGYPPQHPCRPDSNSTGDETKRTWRNMTNNVLSAISSTDYVTWNIPYIYFAGKTGYFGPQPGDTPSELDRECWFIRKTMNGQDEVGRTLQHYGAVKQQ